MNADLNRGRRFRGSVVRTRISRGGFWNTLTTEKHQLVLGRWPLSPVVVEREATAAVRFQKVSLPLWWGTDVMFDTQGRASRYLFRPIRVRALREHLQSLGWPVVQENDLTLGNIARRARP